VGVGEDDIGHYQCNNSVGEVSVGYHVGYSNSGQLGMCCGCGNGMDHRYKAFVLFSTERGHD